MVQVVEQPVRQQVVTQPVVQQQAVRTIVQAAPQVQTIQVGPSTKTRARDEFERLLGIAGCPTPRQHCGLDFQFADSSTWEFGTGTVSASGEDHGEVVAAAGAPRL